MPPNPAAVAKPVGHKWTKFEIHTLLCLMSRNIHIRGLPVPSGEQPGTAIAAGDSSRKSKKKRAEHPHVSKRSAHMDVATALNRALNGLNISHDIDHREVSTMIDKIVIEKKGSLAVVQRQKPKRMTRFLKHVLRRNIGFTGDKEEWDAGRKEEVEKLESGRAERGFTMAMAGVSDAMLGGDDGLGGNDAAPPTIDDSQAVDPWSDEAVLASVEGQNTVPWGDAEATAPVENQIAVEVGWGAGRTTPEEFRPNVSTGCDDDDAQPMPLADIDNAGWGSGPNTAMLTTMRADEVHTDWDSGAVALAPETSSTDPWDSAAATVEPKSTIAKDRGADSHSTLEPWLSTGPAPVKSSSSDARNRFGGSSAVAARTASADSLVDTAVASVENSSSFVSDAWGGYGNELGNVNPPLLDVIGTAESWGDAETGFNTPAQTSLSRLDSRGTDNAPPATSAEICRDPISEEFLPRGSFKPFSGSGSSRHGSFSSFRLSSDPWGGEAPTGVSPTIFSPDPKTGALSSSSVTCSREAAHSSFENPVYQTAMTTTASPSNFFGSETHDQSFVSPNTAQTSPVVAADRGINSERLARLQGQQAYGTSVFVDDTHSDDDPFQEGQKRWMPKGGNALPLPFNRLARRNQIDGLKVSNGQSGNNVGADVDVRIEAAMDVDEQSGESAMDLDNDEE